MSADCGFGSAKGGDAPAQKVFADMNPLEALLFASSSTENCATILSAGIELKPVAIFDIENSTVSLHPDVSSPDELNSSKYYACHSELAKNSDESKTMFAGTMAALLDGHLVTRVRIHFHRSKEYNSILMQMLLPFLTKGKIYDWVDLCDFRFCSLTQTGCDDSLASVIRCLTEMMPVRSLSTQGCKTASCSLEADLLFTHFHPNSRAILESVSGTLRCSNANLISQFQFPNLRSFHNTANVDEELVVDHLTLLQCARIQTWKSGGVSLSFSTKLLQSFEECSSNSDYAKLTSSLSDSTKGLRFANGNWETVHSAERADGAKFEIAVASYEDYYGGYTTIKCGVVHEKKEKKDDE